MATTYLGKRTHTDKLYVELEDGRLLPILDVTDPESAPHYSEAELEEKAAGTIRRLRSTSSMPRFLRKWMAKRSIMMRSMMASRDQVLGGLATYLSKLDPSEFGGFLDRKMLEALGPVTIRMRIHAYARLIADELISTLESAPEKPLHIVDLAGGVAPDAWSVLLLIQKERPDLLASRPVRISLLDMQEEGPEIGQRIIRELMSEGAPLHGLELTAEWIAYDWNQPSTLRDVLEPEAGRELVAVSSEGGVFEYCSDELVREHLELIGKLAEKGTLVFGSMVKDAPVIRTMRETSLLDFFVRTEEDLQRLASESGFRLTQTLPATPTTTSSA